jgi:hypothetical protein
LAPRGRNFTTATADGYAMAPGFLSDDPRVSADEFIEIFPITKIKAAAKLLEIIFNNSLTVKMHDSLPLSLFSRETILAAFGHLWKIELFVIFL